MSVKANLLLFIFIASIGCDQVSTDPTNNKLTTLTVSTDASTYNLQDGYTQVLLNIENHTDSAAYFPHCGERYIFVLRHYADGISEDGNGWGWPCLAIYAMGITELEAGAIYSDVIHIRNIGKYRVLYYYQLDQDISEMSDTLYSNEFTVE